MSDSVTMLERAKSALLARDYSLAAKIYKNLILEDPENIDYKMQLGNLYVKAGKDDQALTIFKQIEKTDNENVDALIAVAGIYRRQKKYDESVAFLEQALVVCEANPKSRAKISYNLGFTYRQMGNYDDAIKCFEEVVEDNPSDVLANNHLGAIYAFKGNHDKAIEAYNRGLKYDANHPILQFNIAKSYAELGENTKALSFYEGALRARPGWTEAIEAYADLLLVENRVAEADNAVTQALDLYPEDVRMLTAKGNVYNRQSIFDNAESQYKKALDIDENYKNALTGLASSLESQEKYEEAVETISRAEKLNPNDLRIMKQAAHIQISAKNLETAYEKILKLQNATKNDIQTINLLGQYYIAKDDNAKAEECFADIKKLNPDYNEVYRDWAERFIQKGDDKRAEPYLHAAIQKNPDDAMAMIHLGKLYERQNQIGKALQFYKKASHADEYNNLSKISSERILGSDEKLANLDAEGLLPSSIDYDSIFSGGKIDSQSSPVEEGEKEAEDSESLPADLNSAIPDDLISDSGEISLAENDAQFEDGSDYEADASEILADSAKNDEDFEFDQFGMEKLADSDSDADSVGSVASLLETDENAMGNDSLVDFEELIDDGAPIDEEDALEPAFEPLPDGTEYIEESAPSNQHSVSHEHYSENSEFESPRAQKHEISDESLDKLEEQIKRAAELAEKANFAAESAWQAASQAADAAQAAEEAKKLPYEAMPVQETEQDEAAPASETDSEDEDFLEDFPDYLQEEEQEKLAESEETEENNSIEEVQERADEVEESEEPDADEALEESPAEAGEEDEAVELPEERKTEELMEDTAGETEAPKIDDLTLRRAIDMLPSIIAAIEDRSVIYRFRSFLSMFKTLREMLEYLPEEQRHEFMTSRNRLLLDYVISKLSGKPGLFATTKALIRSGLIHENPENKPSEKDGIELVKEVLGNLRELTESLEDDSLRQVLKAEADSLEGKI